MSSGPSSEVIVVAARRSTTVQLLDVLRDWSSLGLIKAVHIVDVDAVRRESALVPCTVLERGVTRGSVLQEALAGRDRTELVRLCSLTDVAKIASGVRSDEALSLFSALRTALPGVEILPLHLIGVVHDGPALDADVGWLGWHNILIAPENSLAPTQGVSPIVYSADDPVRLTHIAAAIASLAGLWLAELTGPLDGRPVPPGRSLVAARSFTRHLSAAAVESELLGRLASVERGYPVPVVEGTSAWVIEDEVGAVTDMADALIHKHSYVLPRHRDMPRSTPSKRITASAALRMLFTFLGQAFRNAPRAFLERAINEISARTARVIGGAVFGTGDPEYSIVVNGVRADGLPASWADIDDALEGVAVRVLRSDNVHLSNMDLSNLWRDFIGGGLTLIDAGARSTELPPRMLGTRRGVVITPARVAPYSSEVFEPPSGVAPYIKHKSDQSVSPHDVVGAWALHEKLQTVSEEQPHLRGQVFEARADLVEWFEEREKSYTGRVGLNLAKAVRKVRSEITTLTKALRSAQEATDVPTGIEEQQARLSTKLKSLFLGAFLAAVVVAVVTMLGPQGWRFLVGSLAVIATVWLAWSLLIFVGGQRDLFALLHQRREAAGQVALLRQHLLEAIDDMRRLSRVYRQYLDWAKAFGLFVHAPLGHPAAQVDRELLLGSGFPRNHRFGAARPEKLALDEVSARMKPDMFGVGWGSGAWSAFIVDVPTEMGYEAFRLRQDPELLWADQGVTRHSLLSGWAEALGNRGQWEGATASLRARVGSHLSGRGADLTPRLLANVSTRSSLDGTIESVSYENFISRLHSEAAATGTRQTFDRAMFADHAQSGEPWQVTETIAQSSSANLGRTLVVTQLSGGFSAYDLRLGTQPTISTGTASVERPLIIPASPPPDRPRM